MNHSETAALLTKIARLDKRTIGEADVRAWHDVLGDLPLKPCMDAVDEHFRESHEWCMPVHIVTRVAEKRRQRIEDVCGRNEHPQPCFPIWDDTNEDPADPRTPRKYDRERQDRWKAERDELRRRIEDGEWDLATYAAYHRGGLPLEDFDKHPDPLSFISLDEPGLPREVRAAVEGRKNIKRRE